MCRSVKHLWIIKLISYRNRLAKVYNTSLYIVAQNNPYLAKMAAKLMRAFGITDTDRMWFSWTVAEGPHFESVAESVQTVRPKGPPTKLAPPIFLAHFCRAMLCIRGTSHGPVSGLIVTSRCSTKTAKRRITQTTPHDSPGTLVFCSQRSSRNSTGVTPYGAPNAGGVGQNRRLSTNNRLYLENGTR